MRLIAHPVLCNYYLTYRCNATCSFCDIWEKPSKYVKFEDFKDNLKDLKELGVKIIDFTGGEPLLHKELDKFLSEAKKQGFITTVTTNCLLYPKYAERLRGKVDMLHFSLDSSNEQKHNQSRGVKCFDKVIESINIAINLGEKPDILFTVFEDNILEIETIWRQISQPNNLMLILNPAFNYNNINPSNNLSDTSLKTIRYWGKQKNIYLNEAFIHLRLNGGNDINHPVCKAASSSIVISPDNKLIIPCYHLGTNEYEIKGNLKTLYISNEIKQNIALEGKLPECQGCVINCYMQPSFAVEINKYFWKALPSTIKYNYFKKTWKQLFK